ncbi:MAG: hypothetical protein IJ399_00465 [Bacilli bacterium]|nr:hypothetical protein [Bacilli bacterium]
MRKLFMIIAVSLFFLPFLVKAEENDEQYYITKYYKTVTYNNFISTFYNNSITTEITEEEYNNADTSQSKSATVETTYKKLTSSIAANGSNYRYKAELIWKIIPSVRSYDIIGIGFYQNVKVKNNNLYFNQEYCLSSGSCYNSSINYPQIFSNGAGTSFALPSGSLSSLKETLYFDVEKNTSATITSQLAASDYSHATSTISLANSKKYSVNANGISLNGVSSYYDNINAAKAYWSGSW